jgi:hypothetical protein
LEAARAGAQDFIYVANHLEHNAPHTVDTMVSEQDEGKIKMRLAVMFCRSAAK